MQVLELFSGIGGMHMAFRESGVPGDVKAAIEINTIANSIYEHNFPKTKLLNLNIEGLTADSINKYDVNTILMSPPCQPFTRNGKKFDIKDTRTIAFQHVLDLLPNLHNINKILVENVEGFEKSEMRHVLVKALKENDFVYQEFILSPLEFGIPNSRTRYYCIAKKAPDNFHFETQETVMKALPGYENKEFTCFKIKDILDDGPTLSEYRLLDPVLKKRLRVIDICYGNSRRSCCFTKAYGRFIEGTGSVYTDNSETDVTSILQKLYTMDYNNSEEYMELANSLNLRFFSPKEISKLMCFPDEFSFPKNITDRQKYMVLGNSINVKVVSELIKLLR